MGMRTAQVDKRMRKMTAATGEMSAPALYGPPKADVTCVCWGTTYGPLREAVDRLNAGGGTRANGTHANMLHMSDLWPFPADAVNDALERDRSRRGRLWPKVLALGAMSVAGGPDANLYLADKVHLLAHPEFADVERLRDLLSAIEEKERMIQLLDRILQAEVLEVSIGAEIDDPDIRECALVAAPLGDSPALGGLGVLGPVRMPYGRVIPLVRSLSTLVNRYLS